VRTRDPVEEEDRREHGAGRILACKVECELHRGAPRPLRERGHERSRGWPVGGHDHRSRRDRAAGGIGHPRGTASIDRAHARAQADRARCEARRHRDRQRTHALHRQGGPAAREHREAEAERRNIGLKGWIEEDPREERAQE